MKKFFKDLRTARRSQGLSQEKLAELSGVTALTVSNIERRKTMPIIDTRERLETALDLRIDWLGGAGVRQIKEGRIQFSAMEYRLRMLIFDINFLDQKDQGEFIALAKMYFEQHETSKKEKIK